MINNIKNHLNKKNQKFKQLENPDIIDSIDKIGWFHFNKALDLWSDSSVKSVKYLRRIINNWLLEKRRN